MGAHPGVTRTGIAWRSSDPQPENPSMFRFFREGQAARAIRHPNVVAAYDLRTTDEGITSVFETSSASLARR